MSAVEWGQGIEDAWGDVAEFVPKLVALLVILIIGWRSELRQAPFTGVGAAILVVGVFMALDQLKIAPAIVSSLFDALLAIVVGVMVIAVGGGGIVPIRRRWENTLEKYDQEKPRVQEASQGPETESPTGCRNGPTGFDRTAM